MYDALDWKVEYRQYRWSYYCKNTGKRLHFQLFNCPKLFLSLTKPAINSEMKNIKYYFLGSEEFNSLFYIICDMEEGLYKSMEVWQCHFPFLGNYERLTNQPTDQQFVWLLIHLPTSSPKKCSNSKTKNSIHQLNGWSRYPKFLDKGNEGAEIKMLKWKIPKVIIT